MLVAGAPPQIEDKQKRQKQQHAGLNLVGKSREQGTVLAAHWIDQLRRQHTPYGSLADAGLGAADIPRMVEIAMNVRRLLDPNPVEVSSQDAARIYQGILE